MYDRGGNSTARVNLSKLYNNFSGDFAVISDSRGTTGTSQLRIYGDDHYLHLEIGYHRERNIPGGKSKKVLHYHEYGKDFSRTEAKPITKEIYKKYKKYMKGVKLYD